MEPFMKQEGQGPDLFVLKAWNEERTGLTAGFSGRGGGEGTTPYDSLNLALHVGDDPEDVIVNRKLTAETLGFSFEDWTCGEQVHSSRVAVIGLEERGRGSLTRQSAIQDTDGLLTNIPGVLLTSFYADCVPLYFWDPVHHAVGLAHAGWKGTVLEIASRMVERMSDEFGSCTGDIRTAIGPSIGQCCYEVDDKVMSKVNDLGLSAPGNNDGSGFFYTDKGNGKFMLNLKELNRHIMIKAGILTDHIECTSWCTSCRNDLFFSYRKDGGTTGRMASWIGMRKR
ncbi:peptidoglycan editing factor PgeF [Paenibacillus sp. N3/727]|uniref:peptidoglycan editing factor PgeF n=1 Tax=Paenibacillus sp. N3/727 TaxID=2925845 RepID=UPI001F535FF5|nr:peptidoglycan editing factor PgeF [Paenibacillus sp. N3/727]UNK20114.1 peptidoglycan editing factor PgeF [Paenibacillus sp. N3/727]